MEPARDCRQCERLARFRDANKVHYPGWFNAPVPGFGDQNARLLIVGLAPGLKGANWSGRPFTGDYAGDLLYATLEKFGLTEGSYDARPDDGLMLRDTLITNAVRCVPPQNKPTGPEINQCRPYLTATIKNLPNLRAILALGKIAHDSTVRTLGGKLKDHKFAHNAAHKIAGYTLYDSYHCSRYNTNTRRLTVPMFEAVFTGITAALRAN